MLTDREKQHVIFLLSLFLHYDLFLDNRKHLWRNIWEEDYVWTVKAERLHEMLFIHSPLQFDLGCVTVVTNECSIHFPFFFKFSSSSFLFTDERPKAEKAVVKVVLKEQNMIFETDCAT